MILPKNFFFETSKKYQNKLNSRTWMTLKSLLVIFKPLETYEASLASSASATSLASTASTALFPQNFSSS
jgi:hypothetical protein